jgi:Peptidase family M48/PDZ domain/Domain of unknown function (DUF5666)
MFSAVAPSTNASGSAGSIPRLFLLALLSVLPASAKVIKIHGYVTGIDSSSNFQIEDYRVTHDEGLVLSIDQAQDSDREPFTVGDIRVGTELEVTGQYDEKTGALVAERIKVFPQDSRKVKRTALIEKAPSLLRDSDGSWSGTFFADGQHICVQSITKVVFKLNGSEKLAVRKADTNSDYARPLGSLDEVNPGTWLSYEGRRQEDGTILASKLEFWHAEMKAGEARLWRELTPRMRALHSKGLTYEEVIISRVGKFRLVPSDEAQEYVRRVGESLIPAFEKNLPPSDPRKIPFQFFLVQNKETNAFALANGTVVVNSGLINLLEDEAQLAAVIGHELAHAVQEHTWREQQNHRNIRTALKIGAVVASSMGKQSIADMAVLTEAAIRNGYSRAMENQADRKGLEYMLDGGYDIREAPRVWVLMTKKYGNQRTNFFWSDHDNNLLRRSYLMAEIRNNYSNVDFATLRKDSSSFVEVAEITGGAHLPGTGPGNHSQGLPIHASISPRVPSSKVSTSKADPVIATRAPSTPAPAEITAMRSEEHDAYEHDNALITAWWNLPKINTQESPKAKSNGTASSVNNDDGGSIGVWSDEKPMIRRDGVKISRVARNGPADQAGVQTGDDVLAINGAYVFTVEELIDEMHHCKPGTRVVLRYRRYSTIYDMFVVMGSETTRNAQTEKTQQ